MIVEESIWIGKKLIELPGNVTPILNIGSSDIRFRTIKQPYINKNIFQPLKKKGIEVIHLDLKKGEGIDIAGDFTTTNMVDRLKTYKFKCAICSNLLEHVINPKDVCDTIEEIIKEKGYIIVTVPYLYPHHNDPFDTMFRPDINELSLLFPKTKLIKGAIINSENNLFRVLIKNPKLLFRKMIRYLTPFYKFNEWCKEISYLPNLFKKYQITCIILQKLN